LVNAIGSGKSNPFPGSSFAGLWNNGPEAAERPYPLSELAQMPPVVGLDTPAFHGSLKSLVNGGWHYISSDRGGIELYDWHHDPRELHNLAATAAGKATAEQFSSYLKGVVNHSR
jgi:hypothetical protein